MRPIGNQVSSRKTFGAVSKSIAIAIPPFTLGESPDSILYGTILLPEHRQPTGVFGEYVGVFC